MLLCEWPFVLQFILQCKRKILKSSVIQRVLQWMWRETLKLHCVTMCVALWLVVCVLQCAVQCRRKMLTSWRYSCCVLQCLLQCALQSRRKTLKSVCVALYVAASVKGRRSSHSVLQFVLYKIIAFFTLKYSTLIGGSICSNPSNLRSWSCSHLLLFFFCERKKMLKKNQEGN